VELEEVAGEELHARGDGVAGGEISGMQHGVEVAAGGSPSVANMASYAICSEFDFGDS
jgi:hypothetical protein